VLFVALLWLAFAKPQIAFIVIVVSMALPFVWTPSIGGVFLAPPEIGGIVFLIVGVVRKWWFHVTIIDKILAAYIVVSIISAVVNQEALTLVQFNLQSVALPYFGWRMLFTSSDRVRALVLPCVLCVGAAVAITGLIEFLYGSGLFTHTLVNPKLANWAHTYLRLGHVRITSSFGQPIALGMFLLIPIGFAFSSTTRPRLIALSVLLPAEILTLSRGPWVGTLTLILLLLPLIGKKVKTSSLVASAVVLIAFVVVFAHPVGSVLSSTTEQGTSENANAIYRVDLLQTSFSNARLLGNPFDVESSSNLYGQAGFKDVASWFAGTLGRMGWLGVMCLLAFVGAAIVALWRGYMYSSRTLIIIAAVVLAQMVALTTAPPITNYNAFLWFTIACLSSWFINRNGEMRISPTYTQLYHRGTSADGANPAVPRTRLASHAKSDQTS
jgi:hypothetical protein